MAKLKGNILAVKFNKKELSAVENKLKYLIQKSTPQVSLDVAKRLDKDIKMSGNIPFDTGNLKEDNNVFQDRFDKNFGTIGWFAPYARKMYYGVHGERVWKTIDGKRKAFTVSSTGNGIPFWDKPFTSNKQYMIRIYEWGFRKSNLKRYIER